jgi:hypothetical protein
VSFLPNDPVPPVIKIALSLSIRWYLVKGGMGCFWPVASEQSKIQTEKLSRVFDEEIPPDLGVETVCHESGAVASRQSKRIISQQGVWAIALWVVFEVLVAHLETGFCNAALVMCRDGHVRKMTSGETCRRTGRRASVLNVPDCCQGGPTSRWPRDLCT